MTVCELVMEPTGGCERVLRQGLDVLLLDAQPGAGLERGPLLTLAISHIKSSSWFTILYGQN